MKNIFFFSLKISKKFFLLIKISGKKIENNNVILLRIIKVESKKKFAIFLMLSSCKDLIISETKKKNKK